MRRRPSRLVAVTAAVLALTGCEARVYGTPPPVNPGAPQLTVVAPQGPLAPLPEAAPDEPASTFEGLESRTNQATAEAAAKGADITTVVLDRSTGQRVTNGNGRSIAIASVVKLFIADDMLLRGPPLTPDDEKMFESMLRSSDDSAAQVFWDRNGGTAIVTRVAARYGLSGTRPNGLWFNTLSTAADLVRYYDMMLSGAGGLPRDKADMIVDNLAQSTPTGIDGMMPGGVYPQRFGIPEGLYGEPVAVKQGWMCCIGSDWMHLSTGIIGSDHRYVMAIASDQPATASAARATITQAVKTMFPGGRI
ncbi:serine hydrolase [Mycolicibacterium stellerae]|uniref:serine hydrolase n=1 Tax=Mycolicibacterium stellerae TaxID=2358193 RepID=UPI000F0B0AB7|nr:serine hydrolase [Mycolicibacterium stellerae]